MSISDETWERVRDIAVKKVESYARQDLLGTPEERREAVSDALQHALGLLQLERSVRGEKDFFELLHALRAWPALPPSYILSQLGSYAHHPVDHPDDWTRGKSIQRELPMGRIPYSHEAECGAGVWDRITHGEWRDSHVSPETD